MAFNEEMTLYLLDIAYSSLYIYCYWWIFCYCV